MTLAHHDLCFGCGLANVFGLQIELERRDDGSVAGRFFVKQDHQGPPGCARWHRGRGTRRGGCAGSPATTRMWPSPCVSTSTSEPPRRSETSWRWRPRRARGGRPAVGDGGGPRPGRWRAGDGTWPVRATGSVIGRWPRTLTRKILGRAPGRGRADARRADRPAHRPDPAPGRHRHDGAACSSSSSACRGCGSTARSSTSTTTWSSSTSRTPTTTASCRRSRASTAIHYSRPGNGICHYVSPRALRQARRRSWSAPTRTRTTAARWA